jgi:ankyrin repeat protein
MKRSEFLDETLPSDDAPTEESIWEAAINKDWEIVKQCLALDPLLITVQGEYAHENDRGIPVPYRYLSMLHLAAWDADLEMMDDLISKGADMEAKDPLGYTPMHYAMTKSQKTVGRASAVEATKLLIRKGADVNSKNRRGLSLLHWVAYGVDIEGCTLLLDNGADIEIQDNDGLTPLGCAVGLYGISEDHIFCNYEAPHAKYRVGNERTVRFLLERGANINAQANRGRSLLHLLVMSHQSKQYKQSAIKAISFFLANGADITIQDDEGKTPLDYADAEEVRELFQTQKAT